MVEVTAMVPIWDRVFYMSKLLRQITIYLMSIMALRWQYLWAAKEKAHKTIK